MTVPASRTIVTYYFAPAGEEINTEAVMGSMDVVTALVREYGLRIVGDVDERGLPVAQECAPWSRRGRRPGSTNWSQERFWRRYRTAAQGMSRPYKRTHLAARIGLVYATFCNYLERWGPPPGVAAPGD